jgi:hypothetical protein
MSTATSEPIQQSGFGSADQGTILALGVDTAVVRAALLENVGGRYRLAAWQNQPLRAEVGVVDQCAALLRTLGDQQGRLLLDRARGVPWLSAEDPIRRPPLAQVTATASPRTGVRVWLVGLAPNNSISAARQVLGSCPAQVCGVTRYAANLTVSVLLDALAIGQPDMIVVVGGYDDGAATDMQPLLDLCRLVGSALARTAPAHQPAVVFAGSRRIAAQAVEILQGNLGGTVENVENVHPAPDIIQRSGLAQAVNSYFARLCRRVDGMRELGRWVTSPGRLLAQEAAFSRLVRTWAELQQLPELHGLYTGPTWWLHVWVQQGQRSARWRYVESGKRPAEFADWPPLQFVCGQWPVALWPLPSRFWWDRSGMAPMIAAVGQVAPQAMVQVLQTDLLPLMRARTEALRT